MPRKNKEVFGSVSLKKETIKRLKDYKVEPSQSMEGVIKKLINKKEVDENATQDKDVVEEIHKESIPRPDSEVVGGIIPSPLLKSKRGFLRKKKRFLRRIK